MMVVHCKLALFRKAKLKELERIHDSVRCCEDFGMARADTKVTSLDLLAYWHQLFGGLLVKQVGMHASVRHVRPVTAAC